jgi:uncharacterized delta-60 repeat protein
VSNPAASPLDQLKQREFLNRATANPPRPFESLEHRRLFAAGDLDPTFAGGRVIAGAQVAQELVVDVAVQTDGKVVAAVRTSASNDWGDFSVIRYNANGAIDTTFGGGDGRVDLTFQSATFNHIDAVALRDDGKIVAVGATSFDSTAPQFAVARLNADGTLDTTFDGDGKRSFTFSTSTTNPAYAHGVALAGDKVVIAGSVGNEAAVVRLNANGSFDNTFSGDGRSTIGFSGNRDVANAVAIGPSGQVVIAGFTRQSNGQTDFILAQLTSGGALDSSFSGDGKQETDFLPGVSSWESANAVIVQPDGKVVVGGSVAASETSDFGLARYNTNGTLDGSFGDGGLVVTDVGGDEDSVRDLIRLSDGKIVAGGTGDERRGSDHLDVVLFGYTAGGDEDLSFGTAGRADADFYGTEDAFGGMALAPSGNIVVGSAVNYDTDTSSPWIAGLSRFTAGGVLDSGFGGTGTVTPGLSGFKLAFNEDAPNVAVQPDGKIIAVASTRRLTSSSVDLLVARYNTNGTLDTTFGNGGYAFVDLNGRDDLAVSVVLQDGKIVVAAQVYDPDQLAGVTQTRDESDIGVVRLNADGTPDNTFSGDGKVVVNVGTSKDEPGGIAVAPGGKLVIAFTAREAVVNQPPFCALRLNGDGSLDNTFGTGGIVRVANDDLGEAHGVAGQSDGKVVLVGHGGVARLNTNGQLDNAFSGDGVFIFPSTGTSVGLGSVVIQDSGRIVAGTHRTSAGAVLFGITPTGTSDTTFGENGVASLHADLNGPLRSIALDADDRILFTGGGGGAFALGRLSTDGNLDWFTTFGDAFLGGGTDLAPTPDGKIALVGVGGDVLSTFRVLDTDAGSLRGVTIDGNVLKYNGTSGNDQLSIWRDGDDLVVWLDGATVSYEFASIKSMVLHGMAGNDYIKLHQSLNIPATITGGDGDDRLIGSAGNDEMSGDDGNDHLSGNNGDDFLDGGFGSDVLRGNAGRDTVNYHWRVNRLIVGLDGFQDDGEVGENDFACDDIEILRGGAANDLLGGGSAKIDQVIYGGDGNDTIYGGGASDTLFGEGGNDKLGGGHGDDYLEGGAGHDAIYGDGGEDTLLGLAGNDRLFSARDGILDSLNGGAGSDSADSDLIDNVTGVETFI